MIEKLKQLGKDIEDSWVEGICFSTLCFDQLSKFENDLTLSDFENQISLWTLEGELPKQLNVYDGFGQPPVTVFNNEKFVLDLYFWMNIDTSIHSHAFSGAFKVLYGRSIHEQYLIKPKKNFSPDMMTTEFSKTSVEILKANDCREIVQGNLFNHRLVHLDIPTVTLCARTISDQKSTQWHHFSNGFSVEKKDFSQDDLKCLYYYNYLFNRDQRKGIDYLAKLMETWDRSTLLNLYEKFSMDTMGVSEQAIEVFFDLFLGQFAETQWFKLYVDFFSTLEKNYVELGKETPEARLIEHALSFKYSKEMASELLEEIQNAPLSEEQIELLSTL